MSARTANTMAMLPNDKHPGPGCSCADCLRAYPEQPSSKERVSSRLLNIAGDLADIAANPPHEMDSQAIAKVSAGLIRLAGQVRLGEDIDPRRVPQTQSVPGLFNQVHDFTSACDTFGIELDSDRDRVEIWDHRSTIALNVEQAWSLRDWLNDALSRPSAEPSATLEVPAQHRPGTEPLSRIIGDLDYCLTQVDPIHPLGAALVRIGVALRNLNKRNPEPPAAEPSACRKCGGTKRQWDNGDMIACDCTAEPPDAGYEDALILIWQKLGRFAPIDTPNPVHNERIEKAYYAAENALWKAGRLRHDEKCGLVLVDRPAVTKVDAQTLMDRKLGQSPELPDEHVCDGGWACHLHDVKNADETSAPQQTCAKCGEAVRLVEIHPNGWIELEPHKCHVNYP